MSERDEFRKKYEYYKKMFVNEKAEKDNKMKEIEILKGDNPPGEMKELKVKYEQTKANLNKEY